MATTQPQDDFQKTALRLPRGLHEKVVQAATAAGRSMNSEIISRLEGSFSEAAIPEHLLAPLNWFAHARKIALAEALERVIYAGTHADSPQVLVIRPYLGMTVETMRKLLDVSRDYTHAMSALVIEAQSDEHQAHDKAARKRKGSK